MAVNSIVTKLGDGTTTDFTFSFTGGYMSQDDVKVRVGAEVDGAGNPVYRPRTFPAPGTVRVGGAVPLNGQKVKIFRQTPIVSPINDFANGSVLDDVSLDRGFEQVVKAAQELQDGLADAVSAKDSATAAEAAALIAQAAQTAAEVARDATIGYRDTAGVSATNAGNQATAAASYAGQAATSAADANTAKNGADTAKAGADTAKTSAETARDQAASSAAAASGHASGASASASDASNSKTAAQGSADAASASATTAANWATLVQNTVQPGYGLVKADRGVSDTGFERTSQTYGPMSDQYAFTPARTDTEFYAYVNISGWTEARNGGGAGQGAHRVYYWTGSTWDMVGHEVVVGLASVDNAGGAGNRMYTVVPMTLQLSQSHVSGGKVTLKVYGRTNGADRAIKVNRVSFNVLETRTQ